MTMMKLFLRVGFLFTSGLEAAALILRSVRQHHETAHSFVQPHVGEMTVFTIVGIIVHVYLKQ